MTNTPFLENAAYSSERRTPSDETAWVIEAAGPKYWNGKSWGVDSFTEDHLEAIRFSRFEDGESVRCWLLEKLYPLLATRQHMWVSKP